MTRTGQTQDQDQAYIVVLECYTGRRTDELLTRLWRAGLDEGVHSWVYLLDKRDQTKAEVEQQYKQALGDIRSDLVCAPQAVVLAISHRVYWLLLEEGINCVAVLTANQCQADGSPLSFYLTAD